jgi:hypothetical protein
MLTQAKELGSGRSYGITLDGKRDLDVTRERRDFPSTDFPRTGFQQASLKPRRGVCRNCPRVACDTLNALANASFTLDAIESFLARNSAADMIVQAWIRIVRKGADSVSLCDQPSRYRLRSKRTLSQLLLLQLLFGFDEGNCI